MSVVFAVGDFVSVPFMHTRQLAHLVGFSRDGLTAKIRAWNKTDGKWMPGIRPVLAAGLRCAPAGSNLPEPPPIAKRSKPAAPASAPIAAAPVAAVSDDTKAPRLAIDPTKRTYDAWQAAYDHFNRTLFEGRLPACLVTLQRKSKNAGYFAGRRFGSRDGAEVTDEIALNPSTFAERTVETILSTLVHEMTHLEEHHFGKPSRGAYHNAEWAKLMLRVGLTPTDTGRPGGKMTGQRMTHMIDAGGRFDLSCRELLATGITLPFVELWTEGGAKTRTAKRASKSKYTCPSCEANAWGKPGLFIVCGDCESRMVAEPDAGEGEGAP